jgi:hypothetical protein
MGWQRPTKNRDESFLDEPFHYKREIHEQTTDLAVILCGYIIYGIIVAVIFKKKKIIGEGRRMWKR